MFFFRCFFISLLFLSGNVCADLLDAAESGDSTKIELFLDQGDDINKKSFLKSKAALHYAAEAGQLDAVKTLVGRGANINILSGLDKTPLHFAIEERHEDVARFLLENNAVADVRDVVGDTPLHYAANISDDLVAMLLRSTNNVDAQNKKGRGPLHIAAIKGHLGAGKLLVEHGASIDTADGRGETPLILSVKNNMQDMTTFLISIGANVNATTEQGKTALYFAISDSDIESDIIEMLVDADAEVTYSLLEKAEGNNKVILGEYYVTNNHQQITDEIRELITAEKHDQALALTRKFEFTEDPDILKLKVEAASKLEEYKSKLAAEVVAREEERKRVKEEIKRKEKEEKLASESRSLGLTIDEYKKIREDYDSYEELTQSIATLYRCQKDGSIDDFTVISQGEYFSVEIGENFEEFKIDIISTKIRAAYRFDETKKQYAKHMIKFGDEIFEDHNQFGIMLSMKNIPNLPQLLRNTEKVHVAMRVADVEDYKLGNPPYVFFTIEFDVPVGDAIRKMKSCISELHR